MANHTTNISALLNAKS
uniref:Uncharacterized protein n=1 Tax=Rhizophora mucronata TaxID=61149 RepID=A0A2P2NE42_RHIMU